MKKLKPKSKMGQIDLVLFYVIFLLLAIGVVMVYSSSSYYAMYNVKDSMFFFKKQAFFAVAGLIGMFFMMSYDYHKLKKHVVKITLLCIPLLFLVFLFPGVNGAKRWIDLKIISFQPSEIAKYVVVLFLALALDNKGERIKNFKNGVFPLLCVSGVFAALILAEKNLSIASVIMIVTIIMLFVAGAQKKHMFGIVIPGLAALATLFTVIEPYRRARLLNFIDPWQDPAKNGYQLIQSLLALGAGGVTGLGLGQSRQKTLYMPEPHNDFIFSIIGEELGLIGCIVIIALFLVFVWRGINIAMKSKDMFGTLIAVGITSVIAVQALINVAVVTGSMPVTGVPLPFISYGGTSLFINMIAMGILLNVSRQTQSKREI